jgi:hemerythrin-like domain-containing protein
MMKTDSDSSRRWFLQRVAGAGALAMAWALPVAAAAKQEEEEVSPAEDLMREHGVLKRVLLVYDEVLRRMAAKQDFPAQSLHNAATIIRNFIENYHEKLEEDYLFPRFRKQGKLVELVNTLQAQHQAGRRVTDVTLRLANATSLKDSKSREQLASSLKSFVRMYAPHEAREDTVLFPALHEIVSRNEYDALGEDFEKKEHQLFGEEGFEGQVAKVADIEKSLGIYELAQFTPK